MNLLILSVILTIIYISTMYIMLNRIKQHKENYSNAEYCAIIYFTVLFISIPASLVIMKTKSWFSNKYRLTASTFGYSPFNDGNKQLTGILLYVVFFYISAFMTYKVFAFSYEVNAIVLTGQSGQRLKGNIVDSVLIKTDDGDLFTPVVEVVDGMHKERFTDSIPRQKAEYNLTVQVDLRRSVLEADKYYIEPLNRYLHACWLFIFFGVAWVNTVALTALGFFYVRWIRFRNNNALTTPMTPIAQ